MAQNIAIIGGLGYVGSNIYPYLAKKYNVQVYDILNNHELTIENPIDLSEFDIIIWLNAISSVSECELKPADAYIQNTFLPYFYSQRLQKHQKLIFFSSSAVYGDSKSNNTEENATIPISHYGKSKLMAEKLTNHENTVIFRPSNIYSENTPKGIIYHIRKAIENNTEFNLYGNGEQIRDFIHVEDVKNAIEHVINNNIIGIYNLSSGKSISINELLKICNVKKIQQFDKNDADIDISIVDNSKLLDTGFIISKDIKTLKIC